MTPLEIIKKLVQHQYEWLGYGKLRCRSCGAYAYEDYDRDNTNFRTEPHSDICPFEVGRKLIDQP